MRGRPSRPFVDRGLVTIGLVLLLLTTACSSKAKDDDAASTPESSTPAVESDGDGPLGEALLTTEDVAALPFLGALEAQDLAAGDIFEDPDPRGPCGTPVPKFPNHGAAGRGFSGVDRTVIHLVVEDPAAADILAAHLADIHEPCGPYDSTTNTGATQHVHDIAVRARDGGDGYTMTAVIDNAGQTIHVFTGVTRSGNRLSLVLGVSKDPVALEDAGSVVARADERLRA